MFHTRIGWNHGWRGRLQGGLVSQNERSIKYTCLNVICCFGEQITFCSTFSFHYQKFIGWTMDCSSLLNTCSSLIDNHKNCDFIISKYILFRLLFRKVVYFWFFFDKFNTVILKFTVLIAHAIELINPWKNWSGRFFFNFPNHLALCPILKCLIFLWWILL